ncbi:MAG: hypothetical protein ABUS49_08815, partial [Acidobacteriota bacterium]
MNLFARVFSDRYRTGVFAAGLLWAALIQQGVPYWDADYANVFKPVLTKPLSAHLADLFSPGSTDPENWGFMDRTAEFAVYSLSHSIAGYHPWPYLILRILAFAGLGLVIYRWGLRVLSEQSRDRAPAAAAALFLIVAPGPAAAMVWLPDFAPITECLLALLAYWFWCAVEETPTDWLSLSPGHPEQRRWLTRWAA